MALIKELCGNSTNEVAQQSWQLGSGALLLGVFIIFLCEE